MTQTSQLFTRSDVANLLEVPLRDLTWLVVALAPAKRYRRFEIQRRGGGERTIHAPIKPLKDLQRRLADELTERYDAPARVHGFVPSRSPLTNALIHRNREWVLRVDLADFFPSINFGRVRGLFMSWPFEFGEPAATLLAQICCFEESLPQGAPTSPIVSNFICHSLDKDLARLASSERCSVTRYADDLCLSTDRAYFPHHLAYVKQAETVAGEAIVEIVKGNGFEINPQKTRLMRRTERQRVTGLVVNETVNVSRDYVQDLRNLLYIWKRHGETDAVEAWRRKGGAPNWPPGKSAPLFAQVVRGRVQYVGSVKGWTSSAYLKLAEVLDEVDDGFTLVHKAPPPKPDDRRIVRLLTEGETDVVHMLAAQDWFHARGEFLDLELVADEESSKNGDQRLLQACEGLALTRQPIPCVCLFDRDNDRILKKAIGSGDWKDWKNGVIAVALVDHENDRACIETLYDRSTREIEDDRGMRLFLLSEFDDSGLHVSRRFVAPYPNRKRLVPEPVVAIENSRPVGLSKAAFAAAVAAKEGPFATIGFDGFRATFEVIRRAVALAVPLDDSV